MTGMIFLVQVLGAGWRGRLFGRVFLSVIVPQTHQLARQILTASAVSVPDDHRGQ